MLFQGFIADILQKRKKCFRLKRNGASDVKLYFRDMKIATTTFANAFKAFLQKKYCKQTVEIQKICSWIENSIMNYMYLSRTFYSWKLSIHSVYFTTFYIEHWIHGILLSLLLHKYAKIERVLQVSRRLDKSGFAFHFILKWCALLFLALLRWTFYYLIRYTSVFMF